MEKQGVIAAGITPPERDENEKASADLASHVLQRAADAAKEAAEKPASGK